MSPGEVNRQGCVGMCCACFNLQGKTPAVIAAADPPNMHLILDMLRPLPVLDADTKEQMYTCRNWDRRTMLCTIYEDRPRMCRSFPNEISKCGWKGCMFDSKEVTDADLPDA
jgi:Fe-S-cluster containining protein